MFMKCLRHFICRDGWWAYIVGVPLHGNTCQVGAKFLKIGATRVSPNNIMVSCLEPVNHPTLLLTLLLTSILHVLRVFEHLHMLWMGMWVHPYTLTPVHVGAKFGNIGVKGEPKHPSCMVPCFEPVNHPTLYIMFEPVYMLWMMGK
jgi:hypothetical protein